jgi:hypothetical protein
VTPHQGWTPESHDTSSWSPPRASGSGTWSAPPPPPGGAGGRPVQHGPGAFPPPAAPGPNRRRSRLLLVGAAVLAVAAAAAGVLTYRGFTSGPDTPREAAEAFVSAHQRYEWRAAWELLCNSEQLEQGPLDRYIRTQEAAAAMVRPFKDGLTVTIGEARPDGRSSPQSYLVDVQQSRGNQSHRTELVVVAEDGGFRACGRR